MRMQIKCVSLLTLMMSGAVDGQQSCVGECVLKESVDTQSLLQAKTEIAAYEPKSFGHCASWCHPDPDMCTWQDCKNCGKCSGVALCGGWCAGVADPWSDKCDWSDCKGCQQCVTVATTTTHPIPSTTAGVRDHPASEYPDAFDQATMKYHDWECQELCQSRSELRAGGHGCCSWEDKGNGASLCKFYPGATVNTAWKGNEYRAWDCNGSHCAMKWGVACNEGATGAQPPIQSPPAADSTQDISNWTLVWEDEFDHCNLKQSPDWTFEEFQRTGRLQWYTDKNAECAGGKLVITAKRQTPMEAGYPEWTWRAQYNAADYHYTSSSLTSKGKRTFVLGGCGKVELRAKIDIRYGAFPAWWAMGDFKHAGVQCAWPGCGEIDMMEYAGKHGWLKTNFCVPKGGDASGSIQSGGTCMWTNRITAVDKQWSDSFHTWTMQWSEAQDHIDVSVDGARYMETTFSSADPAVTGRPYNPWRGKPHYMIINLAIGPLGLSGNPGNTSFPMQMEVDYVKHWTC